MNVITSLKWRYATKKFDAKRIVAEEKINILTEAFNLTATSYGLQPLKLVVISDKELQERLLTASMNQRQVADASHLLVICIEKTVKAPFVTGYFERVKELRGTPDLILKPFREMLENKFDTQPEDETRAWAIQQAYLALGNLLTVCAVEQIDCCPMEGFEPHKYDEILNLGNYDLSSVLVMPVGYRAEDDMFADFKKVRRPLEETIIKL
ncbi:NAD(P)H-dependent oxidoreductase [Leeuwenhoekiella sp. MAR_2009_132]|uniref:NAD(P)H-dependent oxidoreductase n=1 Tax=Leeuwenhoekiella sp. MAR_2009_132 TaxID=1392489 RepID=UPI00048EED88|nr:NAD(P)H-dependent oxidoreductase [Leeuwenhoekiella sp. MAR_2009_132]